LSIFITFEGSEGTGKTTQIKKLKKYLESLDYKITVTMEPGGTSLSKKIRDILLYSKNINIDSLTELFLFLADRNHHINKVIQPSLQKGKIVISDRFADSSLAYQGYGRGLDKKLIKSLNNIAAYGLKPDLTIVLDMDVSLGLKRIDKMKKIKEDRIEKENVDFHNKVREGYRAIAKEEPDRVKIIKITKNSSIENVHGKIKELVENILKD
jgi:dTMP kinase